MSLAEKIEQLGQKIAHWAEQLETFWDRLTDGMAIDALWADFKADARAGYDFYAKDVDWEALGKHRGYRHRLYATRALAWALLRKLSPARRIFLLLTIAYVVIDLFQGNGGPGILIASAAFTLLLALELADRVTMKRDLEIAREIQRWLLPCRSRRTWPVSTWHSLSRTGEHRVRRLLRCIPPRRRPPAADCGRRGRQKYSRRAADGYHPGQPRIPLADALVALHELVLGLTATRVRIVWADCASPPHSSASWTCPAAPCSTSALDNNPPVLRRAGECWNGWRPVACPWALWPPARHEQGRVQSCWIPAIYWLCSPMA